MHTYSVAVKAKASERLAARCLERDPYRRDCHDTLRFAPAFDATPPRPACGGSHFEDCVLGGLVVARNSDIGDCRNSECAVPHDREVDDPECPGPTVRASSLDFSLLDVLANQGTRH
jgi:hypothetical protein